MGVWISPALRVAEVPRAASRAQHRFLGNRARRTPRSRMRRQGESLPAPWPPTTPALTAATISTKAFRRSSPMPAARAFSMRPRVHTWQPRVMVTARPIRCFSRSVSSEVWCVRARNSNTNAPSYPIVGLLYFVELGINLDATRSQGRRSTTMRLPGATGYNFMGEPVRITWPLHSCSPNCASRPANQRSDSMGQVSEAASSTDPTTTSLIRHGPE